ncbi:hypothetical protein RB25_23125 [Herbaspirillum rubrisubalbicans]|uniref:HAD family hydrolase n=1 Tax=Herbaspirillum rubrisubalbicans TaxID=80842 RepID=UPI000DC4C6AA|nr:HAD hydrolase-like protein [Herbaspirillum rubrisubalbicans]RAN43659.1 hypothetical protein RB25_23125 [Herbaspirillum rubrisubalbicans]
MGGRPVFSICLFDLDGTLVRTDDLKQVREACKNNADPQNIAAVRQLLASRPDRRIYAQELLNTIRRRFPEMKIGVFTRSPRSYVHIVLSSMYPNFAWDIVVAYEDVQHRKPHGEGIDLVMRNFGVTDAKQVVMVGDTDVDVRAAYHRGCLAVLDKSDWSGFKKGPEQWAALALVADAEINSPTELLNVLGAANSYLPALERLMIEPLSLATLRFDKINHFLPNDFGWDQKPFQISVCGRSFTHVPSLECRRCEHFLTESIIANKDSELFPDTWIEAVRRFVSTANGAFWGERSVIVTTVPHRPERPARLESFLHQFGASVMARPISNLNVIIAPELLGFLDGVKSQHNDSLNREQRFENMRDHLRVRQPELLQSGASVVVLDDVVTTGASLIFSSIRLREAGAKDVQLLAIAKSIGNVL